MSEKPPYRIRPMAELDEVEGAGLTFASTFSGTGGSCLGFRWAGYRCGWANEFVEPARECYLANFPEVEVDPRDVRSVEAGEILEACGVDVGELDVLEGSPPCQPFSTAGKRQRTWGKVRDYSDGNTQRADDLFFEFARLLRELRPRAFTAENVSGLVKGVARGYFKRIMAELADCGYRVRAKVLDAQWLGVPQRRRRVFIVGVREDLGREPAFPRPLPYRYTVRDALPWVSRAVHDRGFGEEEERDFTDLPCPTVTIGVDSVNRYHYQVQGPPVIRVRGPGSYSDGDEHSVDEPAPTVMARGMGGVREYQIGLEGTAIGREWDKLEPGEQSDRYFSLVRAHPDEPCPTVTAIAGQRGAAGVTHPTERRKFTILEVKRICGFPDDFELRGSFVEQWARLGNSVPPPMAYHVARALRDEVLAPGD